MAKGGARPGSGNKKGVKLGPYRPTLDKVQAREALRTIVLREMDALVAAQVSNAKGINYLVSRDPKTGKFIRLTKEQAEAMIDAGLSDKMEIWQQAPNVNAFTDLMNRALDKPKEQEQEIKITGEADLLSALMAGRQRAAARKAGA